MFMYIHVCTISTAASQDDPESTVSGTSRSAKSTRLTSSTVPKFTRASVTSGNAKKGILQIP